MENHEYTSQEYLEARKVVNERIGFYIHLFVYLTVNLFFHFINWKNGGYYWAIFPAAGWGIGLFFHGVGVFGFFNNSAWKQKQIHKELERRRKMTDHPDIS